MYTSCVTRGNTMIISIWLSSNCSAFYFSLFRFTYEYTDFVTTPRLHQQLIFYRRDPGVICTAVAATTPPVRSTGVNKISVLLRFRVIRLRRVRNAPTPSVTKVAHIRSACIRVVGLTLWVCWPENVDQPSYPSLDMGLIGLANSTRAHSAGKYKSTTSCLQLRHLVRISLGMSGVKFRCGAVQKLT